MGSDPSKTNPETSNDEFLEILDLETPAAEQHIQGQIDLTASALPTVQKTHAPIALPELAPNMDALLGLESPAAPSAPTANALKPHIETLPPSTEIPKNALPLPPAEDTVLSVQTNPQQVATIHQAPPPATNLTHIEHSPSIATSPAPQMPSDFEPIELTGTSTALQMAHTATMKLPQTATPRIEQSPKEQAKPARKYVWVATLLIMGVGVAYAAWAIYTQAPHDADPEQVPAAHTVHSISKPEASTQQSQTDWWQLHPQTQLAAATAPKALPLTWQNVDAADYFSLQQALLPLASQGAASESQALQTWIRFRLAKFYNDTVAQQQLAQSTNGHLNRHSPPWQLLNDATLEMALGRPKNVLKVLSKLPKTMARNPHIAWLHLLAQAELNGLQSFNDTKAASSLAAFIRQYPNYHDARLLQARIEMQDPHKRADLVQSAQAAQIWHYPDAQATLAALFLQHHAYDLLDAILGPAELIRTNKLHPTWVQASPEHQEMLWQLHISRHLRMADLQTAWWLSQGYAQTFPQQTKAQQLQSKLQAYLFATIDVPVSKPEAPQSFEQQILHSSAQLFDNLSQATAPKPVIFTPNLVEQSTHRAEPWPQWVTFAQKGDWQHTAFFIDAAFWLEPMAVAPLELLRLWMFVANAAGQSQDVQARGSAALEYLAQKPHEQMVALLADLAHAAHQKSEQIHWLEQLLATHPDNPAMTLSLAEALVDLNRAPQALQALEHLSQINPQISHNPQFLTLEARAYLGQNNPVQARSLLLAAAHIQPSATTYLLIADLEQSRGHLDDSAVAIGQALALEPERTDLALRLGRILVSREQYPQAIQTLKDLLKKAPQMGEASELLADVMHTQGNLPEAQRLYLDALKDLGDRAPLLLKLALLQLHELKDLPAALRTLERAVKIDPKLADSYYYLGMARHDSNQIAQAKEALHTYLRLSPQGSLATDAKEALRTW